MTNPVGAVVLAAGLSRRMGSPKMVLPWGQTTVVGRVVSILETSGIDPIYVVTGGAEALIRQALCQSPAVIIVNPDYLNGEMLTSLQCGLRFLPDTVNAVLVVLGDQPQIEEEVVRKILACWIETGAQLIVPSYQMRRGHPWLVEKQLLPELLALDASKSLRQFLNDHGQVIKYVDVDRPTILMDLDTPDDYRANRPGND